MGGIAAAVSVSDPLTVHDLETMLAEVPHRGAEPDVVVHGRTLLGVVRHLDGQDAGIAVADGMAAAFTGVIDNTEELARSLGRGPEKAPAHLLLDAFRRFGAELPTRLRGEYAVVISDGRRLTYFRDHLGFESLYHRGDGRRCRVASEAKQVVAGSRIPREPDLDVVERIFYRGDDDDAMPAALLGVARVPKATILDSDGSDAHTRRYWEPAHLLETARLSAEEVQGRFDELMAQAAGRMVTGDAVVTLSGGIDSPAVAAYAAPVHLERTGTALPALTAAYPELPSVDESRYARLVAEHLGIPSHSYVQRARLLDRLQDWMRVVDGPVYGVSLPHYEMVYRQVRALGGRIVLSGEWAEHVVGRPFHLVEHLLTHGRVGPLRAHLRAQRARGASLATLARPFVATLAPAWLMAQIWRWQGMQAPAWVDLERAREVGARFCVPAAERWRAQQLGAFTHCAVNVDAAGICQQLCGVRQRHPWADVDLWEFFLSLPADVKFPSLQRRALVRRLLRGRVPDAVLDRQDTTAFNDAIRAGIDYAELERWLLRPSARIGGVDYRLLADRLRARDLSESEHAWARDLAAAHAFLSTW